MNGSTIATLHQLYATEWFTRLGVRDTQAARVLASWDEAVAHCASPEWEALTQEAVNRYTEQLAVRAPDRFRRWNEIVREVKPTVAALVEAKVAATVAAHALPDVVSAAVRWDVLHLCLESEYADVQPPGFFAAQAFWYTVGHFPCGWDGDFPAGTRVVF